MTTETKYSRGAWEVGARSTWDNTLAIISVVMGHQGSRNESCIASVAPKRNYDLQTDEQGGNARLIAAAPELLEACKRLVKDYKSLREEYGLPYVQNCGESMANVAIQSATGQYLQ